MTNGIKVLVNCILGNWVRRLAHESFGCNSSSIGNKENFSFSQNNAVPIKI